MDSKKIILNKILEQKDEEGEYLFSPQNLKHDKLTNDEEGQLLLDVYQKNDNIIIKTVVAGVSADDLDISINNDIITIRGKRELGQEINDEDYFCKECYWGRFSRSVILPFKVDENKLEAVLKNGILTITLPKAKISRVNKIKIKEED